MLGLTSKTRNMQMSEQHGAGQWWYLGENSALVFGLTSKTRKHADVKVREAAEIGNMQTPSRYKSGVGKVIKWGAGKRGSGKAKHRVNDNSRGSTASAKSNTACTQRGIFAFCAQCMVAC